MYRLVYEFGWALTGLVLIGAGIWIWHFNSLHYKEVKNG